MASEACLSLLASTPHFLQGRRVVVDIAAPKGYKVSSKGMLTPKGSTSTYSDFCLPSSYTKPPQHYSYSYPPQPPSPPPSTPVNSSSDHSALLLTSSHYPFSPSLTLPPTHHSHKPPHHHLSLLYAACTQVSAHLHESTALTLWSQFHKKLKEALYPPVAGSSML